MHRVSVFASQTLDTLPTNPGFVIATGIAEVEIKDSYKYVFITTVLNTTITALIVALILGQSSQVLHKREQRQKIVITYFLINESAAWNSYI